MVEHRIHGELMLDLHQFPYDSDNYAVLLNNPATGQTACVDAGSADAVLAALAEKGWSLTQLWITHHHGDHVAGLAAVKAATGCEVLGPSAISGVDRILSGGDSFDFAGHDVQIIHTPGHTLDMLNFHIPSERLIFTGDTLFVMGCGRLFEGSPAQMWESLQKLVGLPSDTLIYCAHEYTLSNAAFAVSVDPSNEALANRVELVKRQREQSLATVPTRLDIELATNPFLRPSDQGIRAHLGMEGASDTEVFTEIRRRKDNF
jgi:hydroxyacylglutathione hydrolase